MNNTFKIAKREYTQHVFTKRFWIALLGVPVMFLGFGLISMLFSLKSVDTRPIGIVDQAGMIRSEEGLKNQKGFFDLLVDFQLFDTSEEATQATKSEALQGFVIIPQDYTSQYTITWYGNKQISSEARDQLTALISKNLLEGERIPNEERIQAGSAIKVESLDGSVQTKGQSWQRIILPILIGVLYFALVIGSGNYLLQSLVGEKENRTIEILLTSVSQNEMMAGKIIGNIGVGITQLLVWAVIAMIGLFIFRSKLSILSELELSWASFGINLIFLLVSFVFTASVMAIFGATMTETQEAQSMMGVIIFPVMVPFYFFAPIMNAPNGVLARVLSYIPFSNPLTMGLRTAFTKVSAGEISLVLLVQVLLAIGAIWLAGRAFKLGMLQLSKRVSLASLFKKEAQNG